MTKQAFPINGRMIEELLSMPPKNIGEPLWVSGDLNSDSVCDQSGNFHHLDGLGHLRFWREDTRSVLLAVFRWFSRWECDH
jgi:hypothetical protein